MKLLKFRIINLLIFISFSSVVSAGIFRLKPGNVETQDTLSFISPFAEENDRCFKCHGQVKYEYTNESLGRQVKAQMFSERIVRKDEFYRSNHKTFSCTDCHSNASNYKEFNCLNCHAHNKTDMDDKHKGESGYAYISASCLNCHPKGIVN